MSTVVTSSTGTTYISGTGSSEFDSSSLIEELVEAKSVPIDNLEDQIDVLNDEIDAWETVQTDLAAVSTAAEALASTDDDDSVWDEKSVYLSSSTLSDLDDIVAVTADDDASLGVYEVEVVSLATTHKVASDEVTDTSSALGYSGSFTVEEEDGTTTTITVTSDMSLEDIVDEINDESGDSGVTASLMKSSDDGYTLLLTSADTGKSLTVTSTSDSDEDDVLQELGITDSSGDFANELQTASDAELTVDGVTITSSSNDIEDLLPGVSISLYDDTAGSTFNLTVGQDLDSVSDAITDLVDAYNTYRTYALTQQETDDDGAADDAYLFGESLLRSANSALYELIGTSVEVDGTTYTLASLGITLDDDNNLEVDDDTLEEMLVQNADVVQAFFQQSTSVSNDDLYVAEVPGDMVSGEYTVEITVDDDGNLETATLNGVELEVENSTITGADGSIYEDLRLVYTGDSDASITLTVEGGLADNIVTAIDAYSDSDDGLVQDTIDSLEDQVDAKTERKERLEEKLEDYEDYLIEYYAKLETAMEEAEVALQQVQELLSSDDDD